jgi:hypothetical protein
MKDDNKGIKKRRRRIPFDSGVKQLQQYYERYGHTAMCLYLYCSGNGVPICVANDSQTSNAKL